jgi:hypothetical protein
VSLSEVAKIPGNLNKGFGPMLGLAKLLKKRNKPPGPAPQEWLLATKLPVASGALFIGDPYSDPADAYVATVPPGTYQIEARLLDLGGEWYTARVRALLEGCDEPRLGKQIGETCTDLAVMAFYDLKAADKAIAGDNDLYMDRVTKKSFAGCGLVQLKLTKPMAIAYVETGFDCGAIVYELRSGRRRIGVEVAMELEELEASLEDEGGESSDPAGFRDGLCIHCQGSGDCYCLRKGAKTPAGCPRCGGSGRCGVCKGQGKTNLG